MRHPPLTSQNPLAAQAVIGLGSSLGDRDEFLRQAIAKIQTFPRSTLRATSSTYATPAAGGVASREFLNTAVLIDTEHSPEALMELLLTAEASLGRTRERRWDDRTIDLDILLWQNPDSRNAIFESRTVVLPHPRLLERNFALIPAAEIAPGWIHPIAQRSLQDLATAMQRDVEGHITRVR